MEQLQATETQRRRVIRFSVPLCLCGYLVWVFAVTSILANPEYEGKNVRRILIEPDGPLTAISNEDIHKLIVLETGQPYGSAQIRDSILRLYASRIFFDVQAGVEEVSPSEVDVTFHLIRKHLIREIAFGGDPKLGQQETRRSLMLREGEPYSEVLMEETLAGIQELYQHNGYYKARIRPEFEVDVEKAQLKMKLEIDSGEQATVAQLNFDTQGPVDMAKIRSLVQTRKQGPYSQVQMDQDLAQVEQFLLSQGYLRPDVYLKEGAPYDQASHQVSLTVRIAPNAQTKVEIRGIDPAREGLDELPKLTNGGTIPILLQESVKGLAERYREHFQEEGYFLAKVESRVVDGAETPSQIVLDVQKGRKYALSEIEFQGNRSVGGNALQPFLDVREAELFNGGKFSKERAERDLDRIKSYYQRLGFMDVKIGYETQARDDDLVVVYKIEEGQRYEVVDIGVMGNAHIDRPTILGEIQSKKGEPFSPFTVAQDRANIIALYENRGYREVDLDTEITYPEPGRAQITYFIQEGPQLFVEHVIITGNFHTREPVIRSEVVIEPGTPLSLDRMLQTETNLYNLIVFNRVEVAQRPSYTDPSHRLVVVNVEEAKRYTLLYGLGYSSDEGVRGTFGITDSNFLGMARALSLNLRASKQRQRGIITYTVPRPFELKLPTVLSLVADNALRRTEEQRKKLGRVSGISGRPFDVFRFIASSQSERKLSQRESFFFRFSYENVRLNIPSALAEPLQFFREEERMRLSKASFSYLNESRDDPTNPRRGFFLTGDATVAARAMGSERQFFRFLAQGQYYQGLTENVFAVGVLRLGAIDPFGRDVLLEQRNLVPISERFFAGGATTLRGLPQDLAGPLLRDQGRIVLVDEFGIPTLDEQGRPRRDEEGNPIEGRPIALGGNALFIANLELRFPLMGPVAGALFYDVGNIFTSVTDLSSAGFSNAVGIGFRVNTPVGPIRFDIGYNPNPPSELNLDTGKREIIPGFKNWNFHLTLGQPF